MKKLLPLLFFAAAISVAQERALTLQDALQIAMENSPQVRQARLSLERSSQSLMAQRAALKTHFALSVNPFSYSLDRRFDRRTNNWYGSENKSSSADLRISQPILWTDGTFNLINRLQYLDAWSEVTNNRSRTYSNNLYLNYQQPIFTYNRTKQEMERLQLDLENSSINYALRRLQLEYDVSSSFYEVYRNRLNYAISQEEFANTQASYQIIKNKVDAGLAAREELYQAELNLLNSESTMMNNRVQLDNSLDAFKKQIGIPVTDSISVIGDVDHQPVKVDLDKAIRHGLANRLELRQREISIQSAYHDLIQTMALNEFKGSIDLFYGFIGVNSRFDQVYNNPDKDRQVSVSFDIPIFDWGERKARIRASQASIEAAKVSQQETEDDIIISIRRAYRQLLNLEKQIEIARQNVRNAELTYDINLERYKNGDLTGMDLNLYQTQLSNAKIQLTDSIINYKLALLNLKIQSLYDFERDQPVIVEIVRDRD
ncbi:MAG: TolC family protein [candidate division KSB1 bacterium]|nr:TolC family protein [candidate division KSB1 bacterium]